MYERIIIIALHRRSIMIALRKVLAHRIPVSAASSRVSREFNRLEKRANLKMALSRRDTPNSQFTNLASHLRCARRKIAVRVAAITDFVRNRFPIPGLHLVYR